MLKNQRIFFLLILIIQILSIGCEKKSFKQTTAYPNETAEQQDERKHWWREARFGMFIHWGLYAVPAGYWNGERFSGYAEWLMNKAQIPIADYEKFASQFNPVKFDAGQWVKIAKQAGMKYIIITSKHHDGFSLWDSKVTDYDIIDATPYQNDILKQLAKACKRHGIKLGFYHSILDWHHPDYLPRRPWDDRPTDSADFNRYIDFMKAQLTELVTNYEDISVIWFDGGWEHDAETYRAEEIVSYLYNLKPDLIINDRIVLPMDFATPEQRIPKEKLPNRDWETCMTINDTWGYHKDDHNWKSSTDLVRKLIDISSKGGNFLLNVGPTAQGLIPEPSVKALKDIGQWMEVNGESIYGTSASIFQFTPWGRSTIKYQRGRRTILYLHVFDWPLDGILKVPGLGNQPVKIYPLKQREKSLSLSWGRGHYTISVSSVEPDEIATVIAMEFRNDVVTYFPPAIKAETNIFVNPLKVELYTPSNQLDIYFSLDGSDPSKDSTRYYDPLQITNSVTLKAQTFFNGRPVSEIVKATLTKVTPEPALKVDNLQDGLKFEYFEGEWDTLPDFDSLTPKTSGITQAINLEKKEKEEYFGLRLSGYVKVNKAEVYLFLLSSDDGSSLVIDDQLVINNDGLHSAQKKRGEIALAPGLHAITINYFNKTGGKQLLLLMSPSGEDPKSIEAKKLFSNK